jgi:hypothetical protein
MHPYAPAVYAVLVADAEVPRPAAYGVFLVVTLVAVMSPTAKSCLLLGLFTVHLVNVVNYFRLGSALPIIFAASAPLDQAFGHAELPLVHRAIYGIRAVALFGGVSETLFGNSTLLIRAYNVLSMAMAVYAPSSVTVTWLFLSVIVPGKVCIGAKQRGLLGTALRLCFATSVFAALSGHDVAQELSIALIAALSL